jgi:hypothetical protein
MRRTCCICITALAIAGCSGPAVAPMPRIETQTVKVPVPVKCEVEVPAAMTYRDQSVAPTAPVDELAQAFVVGRSQRDAMEARLRAALEACR